VLVGLRDFQDEKGDVILKYSPDEARALKKEGHLPEHLHVNDNAAEPGDDIPFVFDQAEDSDSASSEDDKPQIGLDDL
jgi:translation initiation factor 1A